MLRNRILGPLKEWHAALEKEHGKMDEIGAVDAGVILGLLNTVAVWIEELED
jgi:hypothetical protein